MIPLLIAEGAVFALWAFLMFRALFRLRARLARETGAMFPGPVSTLRAFGLWLRTPEFRAERRLLLTVTLVLFALIAAIPLVATR